MIEILFVHYGDPWLRGSENCLLELVSRLDPGRFRTRVVCNQSILAEALRARGIEAERVELPEVMIDGYEVRLQLPGYLAISRWLLEHSASRRPHLVYCNSGRASQAAWLASRLLRVPRLCHIHAPFYRRYYWLWGLWDAQTIVFPSEATRAVSLARHRFRGRARVVRNGVDLDRFRPPLQRDPADRLRLGLDPDEVVVGQVGSLITRKGADVLLSALALLPAPRPRLLLAGSGPERMRLEAQARRLGLADRVHFLGEVGRPEALLGHVLDVHVLAAREEALPLTLLEAAASGTPSIASDVGGAREAVDDERTGLVVPAEDPHALARALGRLVSDTALRRRMGAAARAHAEKHFGIDAFAAGLESEILATLRPGPPGPTDLSPGRRGPGSARSTASP